MGDNADATANAGGNDAEYIKLKVVGQVGTGLENLTMFIKGEAKIFVLDYARRINFF